MFGLFSLPLFANPLPAISIIIDDIGYRYKQDQIALNLPGKLAYGILPNAPGAIQAATKAHALHRDILVHMPMESGDRDRLQAPGTLNASMDWLSFTRAIQKNLAAVPYAIGINNHEGSSLTANRKYMTWLMQELSHHKGMSFIDSRTTHHTVALETAHENGLVATRRDVFLDFEAGAIASQFKELIVLAKKQGTALAIAHPHHETLVFLSQTLPQLESYGIRLISLTELLTLRHNRRNKEWQMSSSPSRKAVKN